jgi:biotin carboxylase
MTQRKSLLLVGGSQSQLRKACAAGCDVVWCQFPGEFTEPDRAMVADTVLTDYTDWETLRPLVLAAHETWHFDAVVSLTEWGLDPAARVNDLLGLSGTGHEVSRRFTDKLAMRRHLATVAPGDPSAVAAAPVTGRRSLADFGDQHGYPFIVKPVSGTASFGVFGVHGQESVPSAAERVRRLRRGTTNRHARPLDVGQFMMEEFIDGPFHTVETFSFHGRHVVLTITEVTTLAERYVHNGHAIPARLDGGIEASIVASVTRFLDLMGLRDGPAHTEVKLTERGVAVIESQHRAGGALFSDMIRTVYGIDPQAMAVTWALGQSDELPERPAPAGGAASWLVQADPGTVVSINGVDDLRADPATIAVSLWFSPGDVIGPFDASWDGLGHVAVRGADAGTAIELCRRSLDRISVVTSPGAITKVPAA